MMISGFSYYLYNTLIYDNLKNFNPYTCDGSSTINEDDDRYKKIIYSIFKFLTPFDFYGYINWFIIISKICL